MFYRFKNPKTVDIIILDSIGKDFFSEFIIDDKYSYKVVESKIDTIFITPQVIWRLLRNIVSISNKERGFLAFIYKIYLLTIIQLYSPKIIITFLDNNSLYHWLIRNDKTKCYMAIQNGIRQKFEFDILKKLIPVKINHDYYFCFGKYDIDFHKKMGFSINKSFPCGSLRLGISQLKLKKVTKKYDICLVSNYKRTNNTNKCAITNEINENNILLDKYIKKYCAFNNKSIIIALRSNDHEEISYFKSIYGDEINMTSGKVQSYTSYKASNESEITIAYQSTLLLETLAVNNKVLHIDFTNNDIFFDYKAPIKYIFKSFNDMEKYLNKIHLMDSQEYNTMMKKQQRYVMNYDHNKPPHEIIYNQIKQVLDSTHYVN